MRHEDQTAFVTGAGQGIGEATAKRFAGAGAFVVATDVDSETGEATVADINDGDYAGEAEFMELDVTDGEAFEATPEQVDREEQGDRDGKERSPNERAGSGATRERRGQDLSADERGAATTDEQVRESEDLPVKLFYGVVPGEIVAPRGDGGFGYDPIFEYDDRTFAEMDPDEKNAVSHRGRALAKFAEWLETRETSE